MSIPRTAVTLALLFCCCGDSLQGDGTGFSPRDAAVPGCVLGAFGGDPAQECIAQWSCTPEGVSTLACGDIPDAGQSCWCILEEASPVLIDEVPTSCMDEAIVTEFARDMCGWDWL